MIITSIQLGMEDRPKDETVAHALGLVYSAA
jgi:hypothetical protein